MDPVGAPRPLPRHPRFRRWPAIAATCVAAASGLISLYWALGGTIGLATIGGGIEAGGRSGAAWATALALGAALVKFVGAGLSAAMVSAFASRLPRRMLLLAGWAGAVVLVLYAVVQMAGATLVLSGAVASDAATDRYALRWHLWLWEPVFLVWGLLLGWATFIFQRHGSGSATPPARFVDS